MESRARMAISVQFGSLISLSVSSGGFRTTMCGSGVTHAAREMRIGLSVKPSFLRLCLSYSLSVFV